MLRGDEFWMTRILINLYLFFGLVWLAGVVI